MSDTTKDNDAVFVEHVRHQDQCARILGDECDCSPEFWFEEMSYKEWKQSIPPCGETRQRDRLPVDTDLPPTLDEKEWPDVIGGVQ